MYLATARRHRWFDSFVPTCTMTWVIKWVLLLHAARSSPTMASHGAWLKVHHRCAFDGECFRLANSYCNLASYSCKCLPTHPVSISNTFCERALQLGRPCEYSASCQYFDVNSVCRLGHGCICKSGFRPLKRRDGSDVCARKGPSDANAHQIEDSDEDSSSEEDNDGDDGDNGIITPMVVGIVLGSVIVCGWSFAICRLYLKRVERKRARQRRKRGNHRRSRSPRSTHSTRPGAAAVPAGAHRPLLSPAPANQISGASSSLQPVPLVPEPELEEPLPAYDGGSPRKFSDLDHEPPPSYEDVMNEISQTV